MGTILRLPKSKEALFASDLSRNSLKKRVGNDFRSTFEACVQTPNIDFEATLWCFSSFFKDRIVFARVSQRERKSNEKVVKSTPRIAQNRPKIDQNRFSEPLRSHFG